MTMDEQSTQAKCRRFDELDLKAAQGLGWTDQERTFMQRHEADCEVCGGLAGGLEALRLDVDLDLDAGGPRSDELTARRVINGALEGALQDDGHEHESALQEPAGAPPTRGRRARLSLALVGLSAAVAAVTALVVAAVVVYTGDDAGGLELSQVAVSSQGDPGAGRILPVLVAGDVRTRRGVVSLGEPLASGAELRVGVGRAALRLGTHTTVLLASHTTVRLLPRDKGHLSLRLVAGELLAKVDPRPGGARFSVRVADARVTVLGTIFGVQNNARGAEVTVLRGEVRVTAARQPTQLVTRTRRYIIGKRSTEMLSATRRRTLWAQARLLDLLATARPARLSLRTDPKGAQVLLDGVALGSTPLDAAIGEGQRELELQLAEHTPVRERVLLRSTASYDRDFQLARLRPRPRRSSGGGPGKEPGAESDVGWRALLREARAKRTARDWKGAARAYGELIRRYPRRGAARTALVSLGFLQLEHLGQPRVALRSFARYLAGGPKGALAREACWGRILALGALGRRKAERRALQGFLKRYPRSVYGQRATSRLRKLGSKSMTHGTP